MAGKNDIRITDLVENPTPRIPICLVLDRSPSMSGETRWGSPIQQTNPSPIDALNDGVKNFFDSVKKDKTACYSAEVSVIAFSGKTTALLDFCTITRANPPKIKLDFEYGGTSIGSAVELALNLLDARKKEYQDAGVDYYQPWLVLMTDGQPTDQTHISISKDISERVLSKKLSIFPIGIGQGADMKILAMFSPKRVPLRLKGLCFNEFFEWLSQSVSITSQSMPGEAIHLDEALIKTWTEL